MASHEFRFLMLDLKKILKARGMTYQDLGKKLKLSEAGVKRIFQCKDGKISTLTRICSALEISFGDLVAASKFSSNEIPTLTDEQDTYFSENYDAFLLFGELISMRRSLKEAQTASGLTDKALEKHLRAFVKFGFVERQAPGKVRITLKGLTARIPRDGKFRPVLRENFTRSLLEKMLSPETNPEWKIFETRGWGLSEENTQSLKHDLNSLLSTYDRLSRRDCAVIAANKLVRVSLALPVLLYDSPYGRDFQPSSKA